MAPYPKRQLTSARKSVSDKKQKETNQAQLSCSFPHAHNESQENPTFRPWTSRFLKRGAHSFQHSKLFTTTKWHTEFQRHPKLTVTKSRKNLACRHLSKEPAAHVPSPTFLSPYSFLSQPVHGERSFAVTVPPETFGTPNTRSVRL